MAKGLGGVWGCGCSCSIGDMSEGERSRLSHNWRSAWRLCGKTLLVVRFRFSIEICEGRLTVRFVVQVLVS